MANNLVWQNDTGCEGCGNVVTRIKYFDFLRCQECLFAFVKASTDNFQRSASNYGDYGLIRVADTNNFKWQGIEGTYVFFVATVSQLKPGQFAEFVRESLKNGTCCKIKFSNLNSSI